MRSHLYLFKATNETEIYIKTKTEIHAITLSTLNSNNKTCDDMHPSAKTDANTFSNMHLNMDFVIDNYSA